MCHRGKRSFPLCDANADDGISTPWHNLTGRAMVAGKVEVLVLVAYLHHSIGLQGTNLNILANVENITETGRRPFILAGDFNAEPSEWNRGSGGLRQWNHQWP